MVLVQLALSKSVSLRALRLLLITEWKNFNRAELISV